MQIEVIRKHLKAEYTIGQMFIDGKFFCNTLEDTDRKLDQTMPLEVIKAVKVYGQTAIPTGTYKVTLYYWAKYKQWYPLLHNVPAYTGILMHGGQTHKDTLGCILLGENKIKGGLVNCSHYVRLLVKLIQEAADRGEDTFITIRY